MVYSLSSASGDVASKWRRAGFAIGAASARDVELHVMLKETVPAALEHTGAASFDEHLTSLQVLKKLIRSIITSTPTDMPSKQIID